MAREIPGFYFDEEKGKYFRIQQSHRVVSGTGHTQQTIKAAQQAKQDRHRAHEQVKRQQVGKIVRSKVLLHTTSPLAARCGASPRHNRDELLRQYGAGLSRCFPDAHGPPYPNPGEGFQGSTFSLNRSGVLYASYRTTSSRIDQRSNSDPYPRLSDEAMDPPYTRFINIQHSVPRPADLVTSVYAGEEECSLLLSDGSHRFTIKPVNSAGTIDSLCFEMSVSHRGVETIWDLDAAKGVPLVSMATNTGVMVAYCRESAIASFISSRELAGREQMNTTWKDAHIIISGERSGRVNFTDARAGSAVVRLLHSSAVLGTLPLRDGNHILTHGFSSTSSYDLRMVRQSPVDPSARFTDSAAHSAAYINFSVPPERHSDHYNRGRKLAYSLPFDLVAAINATTSRPQTPSFVTLYSARTGRVVASPLTNHVYNQPVRSVDIRRVRDGPDSVLVLAENSLDEWAFAKFSCDELQSWGYNLDKNRASGPKSNGWEGVWERGASFNESSAYIPPWAMS